MCLSSGESAVSLVFFLNRSYLANPRKVSSGEPSLDIVFKAF